MKPLLRSLACSTTAVFLAGSPPLAGRSDEVPVSLNDRTGPRALSTLKAEPCNSFVACVWWVTADTTNSTDLCNDFELSIARLCFPSSTLANLNKPKPRQKTMFSRSKVGPWMPNTVPALGA
jgi:hypothetical protein